MMDQIQRQLRAILELLDRFNAKATFFLIGDRAVAAPHLVRMILERGHSIGNHTQTHPQLRFWRLGPKPLRKEIDDFERTMSDRGFPVPSPELCHPGVRTIANWPAGSESELP
jgi:peptidoglycan/xylan/chitin deacetylase (PgdA/CDA1 family)